MKAGKRRVVHGWLNKLLVMSGAITPRALLIKATHDLMKP